MHRRRCCCCCSRSRVRRAGSEETSRVGGHFDAQDREVAGTAGLKVATGLGSLGEVLYLGRPGLGSGWGRPQIRAERSQWTRRSWVGPGFAGMSCNGCRVLRKGCSESCLLRPCLAAVEGADAQGNATLFLAKFFGRAGLMGFIQAVNESQRPGE